MKFSKEYRDTFIEWAEKNGTQISEFVTFKDSKLGGTGVFFNIDKYIQKSGALKQDDHVVLLRIPKRLTLSLDSIAEALLKPQMKHDSNAKENYIKQSDVFQMFLGELTRGFQEGIDPYFRGGLNETNILVGEIQILMVLKTISDKLIASPDTSDDYKTFLKTSPFRTFDRYLDLLYHTNVNSIKLDQYYELFKHNFKYNQREYRVLIEKAKNLAIFAALDNIEEDLGFNPRETVDVRFLQQMESSVISRTLEIPEALEEDRVAKDETNCYAATKHKKLTRVDVEEDGYVEDSEGDGDDEAESEKYGFAVASTLVPVIDFVNHSNDLVNSMFDIDKETNDILLKYLHGDPNTKGEIELFITYSEYEDVFNFINAYGFVPKSSKKNPIYEHAIDREYLSNYQVQSQVDGNKYEHNLAKVLKWLGQAPNIQFVLTYDGDELKDVKLNLDQNFIIFGFTKGLTYDYRKALKIIGELHALDAHEDFIKESLKLEESLASDAIDSEGRTPYKLHGVDGYVDLYTIIENTPDEEINNLMIEFIQFLLNYFRQRIRDLDERVLLKAKDLKSIIVQFAVFEREILRKFIEIAQGFKNTEDFLDLIIGAEDLDSEWLKYRLNPRYIPYEERFELQKKYLTHAYNKLGISDPLGEEEST